MNGNGAKLLPDNLFGTVPAQSPPLEYVDFGENKLTHIGTSLYGLQALKVLNLTANKKIDDINLEALAQLPKLDTLLLSSSGFQFPLASIFTISPPETAASVAVPTSNSPVKRLYLAQNKLVNPDVLRQLAYFRQLEVLSLEGNKFTFVDNIKSLPTWFPNLRTIYIGNVYWWKPFCVPFSDHNMKHLRFIKLQNSTGVVACIVQSVKNVEPISFNHLGNQQTRYMKSDLKRVVLFLQLVQPFRSLRLVIGVIYTLYDPGDNDPFWVKFPLGFRISNMKKSYKISSNS